MGRSRPLAAVALAAAAIAFSAVGAAAQGVVVEARGAGRVEVAPGASATAVFRAVNRFRDSVRATASVDLPPGWRIVAPPEPLALPAGGDDLWLVPFAVPSGAPAGDYVVRLSASGPTGGRDSVRVRVPARRDVGIEAEDAPRFVRAGDRYAVVFRVRNRGNASERLRVVLGASPGPAPRADSTALVLAPGGSASVRAVVETDGKARSAVRQRVQARVVSVGDSAVWETAVALVDVVPSAAGRGGERRRLPAALSLRVDPGAPGGTPAPVPTLSGSGALSRDGATRVDFLFRGRDHPSPFARGDEYRLSLVSPHLDVRLGDGVYELTPLTGSGRYGFGGGATARAGAFSARGFVQSDRRSEAPGAERAAALAVALGAASRAEAGFVSRRGRDTADVVTARLLLAPGRAALLDAEYAADPAGGARALALSLQGTRPHLSYHLRHVEADPGFPGRHGGTRTSEGNLSLSLPAGVYLSGAALRRDAGDAADSPSSVREHRLRVGVRSLLAAQYRSRREWGARVDVESRSVRVSGDWRVGRGWLHPAVELGSTLAPASAGEERPFRELSLHGGVSTQLLSLSGGVERFTGRSPFLGRERDDLSATLQGSLRLGEATVVRAAVRETRRFAPVEATHRSVDLTLDQELMLGHRVVARARLASAGAGAELGEPALVLDYVVPLGVPLPRGGASGRVAGRLYDAETGGGVAGVLVRVGGRVAVTDRDGRWTVSGLPPGAHPVELDRPSAGPDRVVSGPAAPVVEVRAGRTARVEVGLVRSATVSGRIVRVEEGSAGERGMGGVLLLLVCGEEEVRRLSGVEGRFEFTDLRPGRCALGVAEPLPDHHRLEPGELVVDLAPGEVAEPVLRVVPVARRVVIVSEGEVSLDGASTRPAAPPARREVPRPAERRPAPRPAPTPAAPAAPVPAAGAERLPPVESLPPWQRYEVRAGDESLTAIAWLVYVDGSLWPKIWLANRDVLPDPDRLTPGVVLRIPPKGPLTPGEREALRRYRERRR